MSTASEHCCEEYETSQAVRLFSLNPHVRAKYYCTVCIHIAAEPTAVRSDCSMQFSFTLAALALASSTSVAS
jgi:hypothetical protein